MMIDDKIDVTEEHDVSDAVMDHDACDCGDHCNCEHHHHEKTADEMIQFRSMNGRTYLIDPDAINWIETSKPENVLAIQQNMDNIRGLLGELFTEESLEQGMKKILDHVYQYLKDFGFDPVTGYYETLSGITNYEIAAMLCVDALELSNIMLRQCAVFRTGTDLLNQIFGSNDSSKSTS